MYLHEMLSESLNKTEILIASNKEKESEISSLKAELKCVKVELAGVSGTLNQLVKMQHQLANHLLLPQVEPLRAPIPTANELHDVTHDNNIELSEKVSGQESAEEGRDGEEETDGDDVSMAGVVSVSSPPVPPAALLNFEEDTTDQVEDEVVVVATKKRKTDSGGRIVRVDAFAKMAANTMTQTMAEKNIFSGLRQQPMASFIYDVADRRMLTNAHSKNPLKIRWGNRTKEGKERPKVKRMLNFLLHNCQTEEEFHLLAAKDAPLYGDSDPVLVRSRRARINKMAAGMADRLCKWCNANKAGCKVDIDIKKFKAGQLISRIDKQKDKRFFEEVDNLTAILNKKRPKESS